MTRSLDTNILLRWLLGDVQLQASKAAELLRSGEKFYVADLVFVEMSYVLESVYEMSRGQVIANLRAVMSTACLICNRTMLDLALDYYKDFPKLSLADCCLVIYARLNEATPLLTFDKKLANQVKEAELLS
jgi:predicted nucleic-acid-binding protein